MKMIKNIIEYLIAISVIPTIVLTVISVTELKDVRNVQYELLSEEEGVFNITQGTYEKLVANKRIKNYELESNYPLITQDEMERATWKIDDNLKNEIFIDENGQKRIRLNVGQVIINGSETGWVMRKLELYSGYLVSVPIYEMRDLAGYLPQGYVKELDIFFSDRERYDIPYNSWFNGESFVLILPEDFLPVMNIDNFKNYLSENPLTVIYELKVKNPNKKIIESSDISITSDYVRLAKPDDFSNNLNGLYIGSLRDYIDRYEVTDNWIYVYPKDITVEELASRLVGQTLYYELAQPRPVEVYDFSKFRLVFDKNRIRVIFDIDDGYYLWEITKDDKMIPINGQYDLGNIWTVKFYVYEIQQPLIRTLVLLIPLIVISGLLFYMFNIIKKKGISY